MTRPINFYEPAVEGVIERHALPRPDADLPHAGHEIARLTADGRAVALCSADASRHVLEPRAPAAA